MKMKQIRLIRLQIQYDALLIFIYFGQKYSNSRQKLVTKMAVGPTKAFLVTMQVVTPLLCRSKFWQVMCVSVYGIKAVEYTR